MAFGSIRLAGKRLRPLQTRKHLLGSNCQQLSQALIKCLTQIKIDEVEEQYWPLLVMIQRKFKNLLTTSYNHIADEPKKNAFIKALMGSKQIKVILQKQYELDPDNISHLILSLIKRKEQYERSTYLPIFNETCACFIADCILKAPINNSKTAYIALAISLDHIITDPKQLLSKIKNYFSDPSDQKKVEDFFGNAATELLSSKSLPPLGKSQLAHKMIAMFNKNAPTLQLKQRSLTFSEHQEHKLDGLGDSSSNSQAPQDKEQDHEPRFCS